VAFGVTRGVMVVCGDDKVDVSITPDDTVVVIFCDALVPETYCVTVVDGVLVVLDV
jgi:hypothetical protein